MHKMGSGAEVPISLHSHDDFADFQPNSGNTPS